MHAADGESRRLFANGFLVHEANEPSNWRNQRSMQEQLAEQGIPALAGIDTRALTVKLRESGTMKAFLCATGEVALDEAVARARAWEGLDGQDYAAKVTCETPYEWDADGSLSASWGHRGAPARTRSPCGGL